jgi:hypothetical protein
VLLGIWIRKSRAFFANVRPDKVAEQTQPFQGYWQAIDYGYWDDSAGTPVHLPLSEMKLKSQIARPRVYGRLEPRRPYTIIGAAWAGDTDATEIWIQPRAAHPGFRAISSTR